MYGRRLRRNGNQRVSCAPGKRSAAQAACGSPRVVGGLRPGRDVDVQPGDPVTDLAQAQAQARGRGGAVEAGLAQRPCTRISRSCRSRWLCSDGMAGAGASAGRRCGVPPGGLSPAAARASTAVLRQHVHRQVPALAEGHGPVQQVLEFAHIAWRCVGRSAPACRPTAAAPMPDSSQCAAAGSRTGPAGRPGARAGRGMWMSMTLSR